MTMIAHECMNRLDKKGSGTYNGSMIVVISVLISCYHQTKAIAKVISDLKNVLPDARTNVYDGNFTGSTDSTARQSGTCVRNETKQDDVIHSSLCDIDARCCCLAGEDDTDPSEYARGMLNAALDSKADMVVGDRLNATNLAENERYSYKTGNLSVRKLVNILCSGYALAHILSTLIYEAYESWAERVGTCGKKSELQECVLLLGALLVMPYAYIWRAFCSRGRKSANGRFPAYLLTKPLIALLVYCQCSWFFIRQGRVLPVVPASVLLVKTARSRFTERFGRYQTLDPKRV